MDRSAVVDRLDALLTTIESEIMPVPIREVWVFGDLALGLDPVDRLDLYLTKDVLLKDDDQTAINELEETYGVKGLGQTVRADWATQYPDYIRANDNGYADPAQCLAAHLTADAEPIHLEICNTGFADNVTQRLAGAQARNAYEELLDPRGVCLWKDGQRSPTAFDKLRESALAFPTLPDALQSLGMDPAEAESAASTLQTYHDSRSGTTVRGDII